jgi:hypothetical protein
MIALSCDRSALLGLAAALFLWLAAYHLGLAVFILLT